MKLWAQKGGKVGMIFYPSHASKPIDYSQSHRQFQLLKLFSISSTIETTCSAHPKNVTSLSIVGHLHLCFHFWENFGVANVLVSSSGSFQKSFCSNYKKLQNMRKEKVPFFVKAASLHDKVIDTPFSTDLYRLTFYFGSIRFRRSWLLDRTLIKLWTHTDKRT